MCNHCGLKKPCKCDRVMGVNIKFNPFTLIAEIAERLWPGIECDVYFAEIEHFRSGAKAIVSFPEGGGKPEICISPEVTFEGAVELLAHEIAHVVAGEDSDEHGQEWESAFDAIHRAYIEAVETLEGADPE